MLALLLTFGFCSISAMADDDIIIDVTDGVTKEELNDSRVFVKQSGWGKCTLAAATNIIRRAAMLNGDENWDQITESVVKGCGWCWQGLYYKFTVNGYTVEHTTVSSEEEIDELLKAHPEGIEIYDTWVPHAVVLIEHDRENGIWYVVDPSQYVTAEIIPVEESLISIEHVRQVWYVSSPVITTGSRAQQAGTLNEEAAFSSIMDSIAKEASDKEQEQQSVKAVKVTP